MTRRPLPTMPRDWTVTFFESPRYGRGQFQFRSLTPSEALALAKEMCGSAQFILLPEEPSE